METTIQAYACSGCDSNAGSHEVLPYVEGSKRATHKVKVGADWWYVCDGCLSQAKEAAKHFLICGWRTSSEILVEPIS